MMRIVGLFILASISLLASCSKNEQKNSYVLQCEAFVVESQEQYYSPPSSSFGIDTAYFSNKCLYITVVASGCSGSFWQASLFDSEAYLESNPPQRTLRLDLVNEEVCLAIVSKRFSFDMQPVLGSDSAISFQLASWNQPLLYTY